MKAAERLSNQAIDLASGAESPIIGAGAQDAPSWFSYNWPSPRSGIFQLK